MISARLVDKVGRGTLIGCRGLSAQLFPAKRAHARLSSGAIQLTKGGIYDAHTFCARSGLRPSRGRAGVTGPGRRRPCGQRLAPGGSDRGHDSAGDRLRRESRLAHGHPDPGRCRRNPHLHRARRQRHRDHAEREDRLRRRSLHRARSPRSARPPARPAPPSRPGAAPTLSRSRRTGKPPTSPISTRARSPRSTPPPTPQACPITTGYAPYAIAITPNGKTAYVANFGAGTVTPIRTATNTPGPPITTWIRAVRHRDHPRRENRLRRQLMTRAR